MALRGAIASLAQGGPFTVVRRSAGARVKGSYQSGPTELTIVDDIVEAVNTTNGKLTLTAHGLETGDGPVQFASTGALPAGLVGGTDYWIVRVDANTIQVADSVEGATSAGPGFDTLEITDAGSGVITLSDTPDTLRQNATYHKMVASIQPVSGAEKKEIPEAKRSEESIVIYTQLRLHTIETAVEADLVEFAYDDDDPVEPWEVYKVETFRAFGDVHYRAYAARLGTP